MAEEWKWGDFLFWWKENVHWSWVNFAVLTALMYFMILEIIVDAGKVGKQKTRFHVCGLYSRSPHEFSLGLVFYGRSEIKAHIYLSRSVETQFHTAVFVLNSAKIFIHFMGGAFQRIFFLIQILSFVLFFELFPVCRRYFRLVKQPL